MHQPHEHRHPDENDSFTFKCLAALAVTVAVIALPLLIIPLLIALLFYALFSNNRQPPVHVNVAREGGSFDWIGSFFRPTNHAHQYPRGHFHQNRENVHQHHHQTHQSDLYCNHGNDHRSSDLYESHHHGHR